MALSAVGGLVDYDQSLIGCGSGSRMTFQITGGLLGTCLFPISLNIAGNSYVTTALITPVFTGFVPICVFAVRCKEFLPYLFSLHTSLPAGRVFFLLFLPPNAIFSS